MIAVTVKNRKAVAVPLSPVTSGAVGVPVVFSFSEDWDGLTRTAVFKGSDEEVDVLIVNDQCELPWETVEDPYGQLEIGVYGANGAGTKVIPTIWARIDRIELGTDLSGVTPAEPTPEMWAQMEELAETVGAANALVAEGYALGTQDGTPVESGTYYHNNSKYYSEQASESATAAETAQGKAEDAQTAAETAQGKAEDAQTAAETAQGLAEDAQTAAETAQGKAEDAQTAAEAALAEFTTPTASATTLAAGSQATASYSSGNFAFGIPQGAKGDPGTPGENGDKGDPGETYVLDVSPNILIYNPTEEEGSRLHPDAVTVKAYKIVGGTRTSYVPSNFYIEFNEVQGMGSCFAFAPSQGSSSHTFTISGSEFAAVDDTWVGSVYVTNGSGTTMAKSFMTITRAATDAGDVPYDPTETYTSGTVGSAINTIMVKTETVTGSTPSITGVENTRYICGEVSTLSITPPSSGIIDVIFTSGTSPTILTLPNTVMMPDWFSVEASTTYEINIADGVYGTVMAWA